MLARMICGQCGHANRPDVSNCERCGAQLAQWGQSPDRATAPGYGDAVAPGAGAFPPTAAHPQMGGAPSQPPPGMQSAPMQSQPPPGFSNQGPSGFSAPPGGGAPQQPSQPPPGGAPLPGAVPAAAQPKPKKGGAGGLIAIILVFFVFTGAGGAAAAYFLWWLPSQNGSDAVADAQEATDRAQEQAQQAQEQATRAAQEAQDQANQAAQGAGAPPPAEAPAEAPVAEAPVAEAPVAEAPPVEAPVEAPPVEAPPPVAPVQAPPVQAPPPEAPPTEARPRPRQTYEARARSAVQTASRQCYVQAGAHGPVTVQISVGFDGRISTSRVVENGTGDQNVARCISGALVGRRIGGSGPPGGGTLNVSFSG